jgi:hypothetical protein
MQRTTQGAAPLQHPVRRDIGLFLQKQAASRRTTHPYCVAVYWSLDDEYGSVSRFKTEEEARRHRNWLLSPGMGYQNVLLWKDAPREIIAV